jgi:DNA-binding NarL/FixJ family response regulator
MKKIKVVLADDHSLVRQSMARLLTEYEDIEIVGLAADVQELIKLVDENNPDVIVVDIEMPGKNIFENITELRKQNTQPKILILTMHDSSDWVFKALENGISGYLTKFSEKEELVNAIRIVYEGKEYYSQNIKDIIEKGLTDQRDGKNPLSRLSKREIEILELLAEGEKTKVIAEKLYISERTVSNHRANILAKLGVSNTPELLKIYYKFNNN